MLQMGWSCCEFACRGYFYLETELNGISMGFEQHSTVLYSFFLGFRLTLSSASQGDVLKSQPSKGIAGRCDEWVEGWQWAQGYIVQILPMRNLTRRIAPLFSTITHIRGKPSLVDTKQVKLRGIHIQSTEPDNPTLIFIPEMFDQAENWLNFFSDPNNKIIQQRNVYILYPRNFGNSDHCAQFGWEDVANDLARFMYENRISMATLGGHGIGAKIALAAACYHFEHVTGYFGLDSSPMNQYYHQAITELRHCFGKSGDFDLNRSYGAISHELKNTVVCPKWRNIFLSNLVKTEGGYEWNFNYEAVKRNLLGDSPSNLTSWHTSVGLYPGRAMFAFPEYSRYVHLSTNTLPMYSVCPRLQGLNQDIFAIQGDDSPQSHWLYELSDSTNPFAYKISEFCRHYDGVNVLLRNRDEIGKTFIPELNNERVVRPDFADSHAPAHYHHNWRFNNVYQTQK